MFMIIWSSIAVAVFSYVLYRAIGFSIEAAPIIGWWGPGYLCFLALAFLLIWIARLIMYVAKFRKGEHS